VTALAAEGPAARRIGATLATAAVALLCFAALGASGAEAKLKLKRVGRFQAPVYVAAAPGVKGIFVVEQAGRIRLLRKGKRRTFLDIRGEVLHGGEQGLLSVAFAPDYARSGLFYVYFTTNGGDIAIEEYRRATPKRADRGSARRILTVNHPGESNHNGGQVQFGPDGFLYAGTGDGGGAGDPDNSAQDPGSMLGKILRIDPNPGGSPSTEVYSLGLRNPFRFSFDLVSAGQPRIVIGDVGQNRFEEVDYETLAGARGANFGWNDFEGFSPFEGANPPGPSRHDRPIKVYSLGGERCALIGGYVVRARSLKGLFKRYVYGDFCAGKLRAFTPKLGGAKRDRGLGLRVPSLTSFGEGPGGSLYATSLDGPVLRVVSKRGKKR
jgi:glucose/arabinose dehydrogenase